MRVAGCGMRFPRPQPAFRIPQPMRSPWLLAARPKTLSASVVPVLVGTALVPPRPIPWLIAGCALFGAIFIQIGTNLVNDALDFKRGADTSARLGPLRVTQAGLLTHAAVMRGAIVCFVLAGALGVPLILRGGWPMLAIGVASIAMAYAYTGGPYPLAYHGLGELFVLIFFGFIAVCGTYYVETLTLAPAAWLGGFCVGLLAIALLAINNLRDIESDRASRKLTMAARFGERFAKTEIVLAVLLPFALATVRWTVLLAMPLAVLVIVRVMKSRGAELNKCLAMAGGLQWAFGILFLL